jgi:hypothetical protein
MNLDIFICQSLKTYDSYPPYNLKKNKYKLVKQISEIKTKAEIDLYLLARNKCFNLIDFLNNNISISVSGCYTEIKLLNKIKWKLPSQYDLLDVFWYYDKKNVFINLQYTTFSQTSSNKKCRTSILINFREIIALLHKINSNIIYTLKSIKYKELYQNTLLAFELWSEVAQKEISISVFSLTKREVFGKF